MELDERSFQFDEKKLSAIQSSGSKKIGHSSQNWKSDWLSEILKIR